jgi:hypothetical protein
MIPYIGFEILDVLRHRPRTLSCPPAISPRPPHLDISDESDSVLSRSVAKKLSILNKIDTMVPQSTRARAITLALYLLSR